MIFAKNPPKCPFLKVCIGSALDERYDSASLEAKDGFEIL